MLTLHALICMICEHQVAREFGIEGGLEKFKLAIQDTTTPIALGIVSPSEKERAEVLSPSAAADAAEGAALCLRTMSKAHGLDSRLICSAAELREELVANWRSIQLFLFDTTAVEFDAWALMDVVRKHRRDFVRTRPAIVILNSTSIPDKQR